MKEEMLEFFRKAGYKSQAELAKALVDSGFLSGSYKSASGYLNQIINGKRPASDKIANGLSALCGEEVKGLLERAPNQNKPLDRNLESFLDDTYRDLKHRFSEAEPTDKMRMCVDFRAYVDNHSSEE